MRTATVRSVCECQARLEAVLDEQRNVVHGSARRLPREPAETAPASVLGKGATFQVGWFCPFCIRNTLRAFHVSALSWREEAAPTQPSPEAATAETA
jgi:hypothetical protein